MIPQSNSEDIAWVERRINRMSTLPSLYEATDGRFRMNSLIAAALTAINYGNTSADSKSTMKLWISILITLSHYDTLLN